MNANKAVSNSLSETSPLSIKSKSLELVLCVHQRKPVSVSIRQEHDSFSGTQNRIRRKEWRWKWNDDAVKRSSIFASFKELFPLNCFNRIHHHKPNSLPCEHAAWQWCTQVTPCQLSEGWITKCHQRWIDDSWIAFRL